MKKTPERTEAGGSIIMKTKTGKQSDYQKDYQKRVEAEGGKYAVCRSLEDFIAVVDTYLHLKE